MLDVDLLKRRRRPFLVAAALAVVVCIAVVQLPDSFVGQLERNRPLTDAQAGWAYRLLAFFAIGLMFYGGFAVFRTQRIADARVRDERLARMPKVKIVASLARNAAGMVFITIVYGIASLALTGQRGGFWLFPVVAVLQGAWYYREIGQVARWSAFQMEADQKDPDRGAWSREPPGYCPPIARELTVVEPDTRPASA